MPLTVGERSIRPLTADDVMRMAQAGILGEDDRVELLGGVLTEVSPKSPEHGTVIARLVRWLIASDPVERYEVRSEHPLSVPDQRSLPEPDIAVIERGVVGRHPTTALLVVEVAVSSLMTDTEVKAPLYAGAGVPEYWVVDVARRRVHVFSAPRAGSYTASRIVEPPAPLVPAAVDVPPLRLGALFDGL